MKVMAQIGLDLDFTKQINLLIQRTEKEHTPVKIKKKIGKFFPLRKHRLFCDGKFQSEQNKMQCEKHSFGNFSQFDRKLHLPKHKDKQNLLYIL